MKLKTLSLVLLGVLAALLTGTAVAEITLTTPEAVRSEVGGTATVNYDRIRILTITCSPDGDTVVAAFELFASSDAARPPYRGTYRVDATATTASIEIPGLGINTGITLSGPQAANVVAFIDDLVGTIEGSMDTFGLVDGQ
jgi:hypothetical protein